MRSHARHDQGKRLRQFTSPVGLPSVTYSRTIDDDRNQIYRLSPAKDIQHAIWLYLHPEVPRCRTGRHAAMKRITTSIEVFSSIDPRDLTTGPSYACLARGPLQFGRLAVGTPRLQTTAMRTQRTGHMWTSDNRRPLQFRLDSSDRYARKVVINQPVLCTPLPVLSKACHSNPAPLKRRCRRTARKPRGAA